MTKMRVLSITLLLLLGIAAFEAVHRNGYVDQAAASIGEVPPGLIPGATFAVRGGADEDTLKVIEVKGQWVHAKVIKSAWWKPDVEIWMNLAAVHEIAVEGK